VMTNPRDAFMSEMDPIRSRIPRPLSDIGPVDGTKIFDFEKCCDLEIGV